MTRSEELQRLIPLYLSETGKTTWENIDVANWAIKRGVKPPKPKTEAELLAEQFSQALREEHRRDPETGLDYRANHAFKEKHGDKQLTFWVQLENATHPQMSASATNRRDGIIADCAQLKKDLIVWNNKNPNENSLNMVLDFEEDVSERLASEGYLEVEMA
jgi:hypothetical protein